MRCVQVHCRDARDTSRLKVHFFKRPLHHYQIVKFNLNLSYIRTNYKRQLKVIAHKVIKPMVNLWVTVCPGTAYNISNIKRNNHVLIFDFDWQNFFGLAELDDFHCALCRFDSRSQRLKFHSLWLFAPKHLLAPPQFNSYLLLFIDELLWNHFGIQLLLWYISRVRAWILWLILWHNLTWVPNRRLKRCHYTLSNSNMKLWVGREIHYSYEETVGL